MNKAKILICTFILIIYLPNTLSSLMSQQLKDEIREYVYSLKNEIKAEIIKELKLNNQNIQKTSFSNNDVKENERIFLQEDDKVTEAFRYISDSIVDLQNKIIKQNETIVDYGNKLNNIESKANSNEYRIGSLEGRTGNLEARTGSLEGRTGNLEARTGSLEGRMLPRDEYGSYFVNYFSSLPERHANMEFRHLNTKYKQLPNNILVQILS